MRRILYAGLILIIIAACQSDQKYDKSLIPETTTLDVSKQIDMKAYLNLTEEQKEKWDTIDISYAEKHIINLETENTEKKTENYKQINAEYESELYALLDKEQKKRFLDYKAYEKIRRKEKSFKKMNRQQQRDTE